MKMKKIIVPKYVFKDELGEFVFQDVTLLFPSDSVVTPDSFDQDSDDYSISSEEIDRMGFESGRRFFNEKYIRVLLGEHSLTPKEVNGIRLFLDCNGSELGKLIDLDKSSVSRILQGEQQIKKNTMILLMEKLKNEIEYRGSTRAFLEKLESDNEKRSDLRMPPILIAEVIIRKFVSLEECITNLKLQKLLYYAQGISIGKFGCKLFDDPICAWEHGPVVEDVWKVYTVNRANPLPTNPTADISIVEKNDLVMDILEETIELYGKYSAWVLRDKTHAERPWVETSRNQVISDDLMQDFFRDQLI